MKTYAGIFPGATSVQSLLDPIKNAMCPAGCIFPGWHFAEYISVVVCHDGKE